MSISLLGRGAVIAAACMVGIISLVAFDGERVVISAGLGWAMLAIAVSDAKRFIIPDALSLPAIPLGLLASGISSQTWDFGRTVLEHTIAAAAICGSLWLVRRAYYSLRQIHGLGLGDVKLGAVAGAWMGVQGAINALLLACIFALCYAIVWGLLTRRPLTRTSVLPLGVFLAPAIWITWCVIGMSAPAAIEDVELSSYLIVPSPVG